MENLKIGDVARLVGRHVETIRDYGKRGVIPKARRDIAGWRVYSRKDVDTIQRIIVGEPKEAVLA